MEPFYMNLPNNHVLKTLYLEHEIILKTLDEISDINTKIQKIQDLEPAIPLLSELHQLSTILTDSEPHHQREEEALFPVMIERGMGGPPTVMTMEHGPIRELKHSLKDISINYKNVSWDELKSAINKNSIGLCQMLSDHIQKENQMCYPMALQGIPEKHVWHEIKKKADKIGYCSFTPK